MSNNCTTNHAIMFFFLLSLLLVYNHDFFSSPSKPTKSRSRSSSCSCNCPSTAAVVAFPSDPTIILFLAFFSGVLFTLLCVLTIRFPAIFTAPVTSAVLVALDFSSSFVRRIKLIRSSPPPPQPVGRHHSTAATGGGISDSLLKTLPIFDYSTEKRPNFGKDAGLCAICLSEFLSEQTLRWLPDCDHLFHRGCIDTWLKSHKTCPCCRANVERAGGEIMLLENGENSVAPEIGYSFRRLPGGDGGRDLDDRRRVGCERSVVSGLIRVLMGRRRNQGNRLRHR